MRTPRRTALPLLVSTAAVVTLAACGGGSNTVQLTPDKAIAVAKKEFDATPGVHVTLAGKDLPSGNVLASADGTLTRAPAFDGKIGVRVLGSTAQVPVISVDDRVYAKLPLTLSWQEIDPANYGVPDPASLIDPDTGISHLLTATTGLKTQGSVRGGKDNKEVLTTYTGTLPGPAVATIIPDATGSFAVSYTLGAKHRLEQAEITGHFYGADKPQSTYRVTLDDYGIAKTITKP
ncbi:MAG TPA: LppX_LprAFG lipoprotein [Marmoricola sp.]|nr:LppX_LprAFG lipoprotein [Marmoricola sp.]